MLTAGPARLVFPAAARSAGPERAVVAGLVAFGRRTLCRLHGHAMLLHSEPGRLSLRCPFCGAATPGWAIDVHPAFGRGRR